MSKLRFVFAAALVLAAVGPAQKRLEWVATLEASSQEVGLGVTWMHARYESLFDRPQSISVLLVEPRRGGARCDVAQAEGRELTSALARAGGALAAVNGGFFALDSGAPVGYLKLDGEVVHGPHDQAEPGFGVDDKGRVEIGIMPQGDWHQMFEALGAWPRLVENGRVIDHGAKQREIRHPRTGLGVRDDGTVVLVVADGRTEQAGGLSLDEFGEMYVALGCEDAVNLDGGGSSVLWIRGRGEGGVVSYPCDNGQYDHAGERKVGNAVLVHAPAVVVIDNDGAAYEPSGAQLVSRDDRDGFVGADFAWGEDGDGVRARWQLVLPFGGAWEVHARWPNLRGREAGRAVLRAGTLEEPVDQRRRGGRWMRVGTFEAAAGEPAAIALEGVPGQPIAVDALRLVQLAGR